MPLCLTRFRPFRNWNWELELQEFIEKAMLALGLLPTGSPLFCPGTDAFLYSYVRKEAVLSSQIEGTQSQPLRPAAI